MIRHVFIAVLIACALFIPEPDSVTASQASPLPAPQAPQVPRAPTEQREYLLGQAYWSDTSGKASFEQAQNQSYTAFQGIASLGYSDGVSWIRLTVAASDTPLGLFLSPVWLDEITLYDPAAPSQQKTVGDRQPAIQNAFHGLVHSFALQPSIVDRQVWLRVKSVSTHLIRIDIQPNNQIQRSITTRIVWSAAYATVLLMMLIVLLIIWRLQRDRVLGAFLLRHATFTYYVLAFLGLPQFLFSGWLAPGFFDKAFSISAVALIPIGLRFDLELLSTYKPNRQLLNLIKVLIGIGVGLLILLVAGYERQALNLNALITMPTVLIVFLTALTCRPEAAVDRLISKRSLIAYHAVVMIGLIISAMSIVSWIQPRPWILQIMILHGLVSGMVMMVLLIIRSQRRTREAQQMNWDLNRTQENLELEQRRRQAQSQFLQMLTHELKTPLSVVSLALGTQHNREQNLHHAGRAIQDMKSILERCVEAERLGGAELATHIESLDVNPIIQSLSESIPGLPERLEFTSLPHTPIRTDRQLLQIVLNNLLHNATRYGDPLSPVKVSLHHLRHQGQEGIVVVVANRPGLAGWPEPEKVFKKYYRAPGALRESGSGLGLYLAQQLAQSLGGYLNYCPTDTEVQFELWLPKTSA